MATDSPQQQNGFAQYAPLAWSAVIVKLALVLPAGTVTPPDGVTTCPSMLPFTHTDAPPAGAGAVSVTVPVVVWPPSTLGDCSVTVDRLAGGGGVPAGRRLTRTSGAR